MNQPLVYLNGRMVPASEAHISFYDMGVVMGATVTEMTRTFHKRLFRLDEHIDRLFCSLRYTRMNIGLSKNELAAVTQELAAHNAGLIEDWGELGLVHFVTAGEVPTYAGSSGRAARTTPTVCVHTFPMPFELWAPKFQTGMHLVTPSIRHVPPQCYDPKMKYRSRMHYYLADHEARLADPDAAALLLDLDGNVTETSGANFTLVERGTIVSPTLRNTLPGISRAMVIELAHKLHIPFVERDSQVYHVMNADEAFLSSTPFCLLPVTRINGAPIGDGKPGSMFRRLLKAWSEEVGLDVEKQIVEGGKLRQAKTSSGSLPMKRDTADWSRFSTSQRIKHLELEGYVVLPNLLSGEEIARIKAELVRLPTKPTDYSDNQRGYADVQWTDSPHAIDLIALPSVIEFLQTLFGDELICTSCTYAVSRPGHPGIAIHTDAQPYGSAIFGMQASAPRLVRVLHYLDDLTPERSPFKVIPRSHLSLHADGNPYKRYLSHPEEVMVTCQAGSAAIIHQAVFHANYPNLSQEDRNMLAIAYRPAWAGPIAQVPERDAEKVAKLPVHVQRFFKSLNTKEIDFHVKNRPDHMATEAPGINPSRWGEV